MTDPHVVAVSVEGARVMGIPGTPLVSVIIPVHNGELFLPRALDSVRAQSYPGRLEVIVIDDASYDSSAEIARRSGAVTLRVDQNEGPAAARNRGLAKASGRFITFLDADDEMAPTRILKQVRYLMERTEVSCVLTGQKIVVDPESVPPPQFAAFKDAAAPPAMLSAMVRSSVVRSVGGFDPSYRVGEDSEWLMRVRRAGCRIDTIQEPLLIRHIHGRNLSYQTADLKGELFRALRRSRTSDP